MFTLDSLEISLINVIDAPLAADLTYTIINSGVTTSRKGALPLIKGNNTIPLNELINEGPQFELHLNIIHEQYANLSCSIRLDGQKTLRWNNRNVSISFRNTVLVIKIILSRLRQAPIVVITKKLKSQVIANPDKNVMPFAQAESLVESALITGVWNDPDAPTQRYWGLESFDQPMTIRTIKNDNGIPIKTADAEAWDRFFFEDASVKLQDEGGFLWLEYGAVDSPTNNKPRFLIGLWVPKKTGDKPLDIIVNFGHSPTAWKLPGITFPYRGGPYPYSINKLDSFTPGHPQPYTHFGLAYFFQTSNFSFHFAAQSAASKKPAVIVMPIIPLETQAGKFGQPFLNQQGLYRLLLELKQFLVQQGYSDLSTFPFSDWQGRTAKIGNLNTPSMADNNFISATPKELKLGNIVLQAHSSGQVFLTSLIGAKALANKTDYPYELFGAKESEFEALWKEIWDLDISHDGTLPVEDYIKLVVSWYKRGNRVLRLYRSQHTFTDINSFDELRKLTPLRINKAKGNQSASYWHNAKEDVSFLFLNNGYVSTTQAFPGIAPRFLSPGEEWWRYHQAPMILGFGHASKMRVSS